MQPGYEVYSTGLNLSAKQYLRLILKFDLRQGLVGRFAILSTCHFVKHLNGRLHRGNHFEGEGCTVDLLVDTCLDKLLFY
jgi:hypothetical protein